MPRNVLSPVSVTVPVPTLVNTSSPGVKGSAVNTPLKTLRAPLTRIVSAPAPSRTVPVPPSDPIASRKPLRLSTPGASTVISSQH